MYTPPAFKLDDVPRLHDLIQQHPFAPLLTAHDGDTAITHLPFMVDPVRGKYGTLIAHMARANAHWKLFDGKREALVIFTGANAYISPSWYEDPVTVPTWNYAVVHVYGRPAVVPEKARVRAILEQLVTIHEAYVHPPWRTSQASDYIDNQIQYIVAFEIPIERLEGKFKFNQNRSRGDQEGVVRALANSADPLKREVAKLMTENLKR